MMKGDGCSYDFEAFGFMFVELIAESFVSVLAEQGFMPLIKGMPRKKKKRLAGTKGSKKRILLQSGLVKMLGASYGPRAFPQHGH